MTTHKVQLHILLLTFCVLFPTQTFASEPVSHQDLRQVIRSITGEGGTMPAQFKVIEKDIRGYINTQRIYPETAGKAYDAAREVALRRPNNQAELTKIANEFDLYIRQLKFMHEQKKQYFKNMQATAEGRFLWGAFSADYPAFDESLVSAHLDREHASLILILTATRDIYAGLSRISTLFTATHGQLFFSSPSQHYLYWKYITDVRNGFKESVQAKYNEYTYLKSEPRAGLVYGLNYVESLSESLIHLKSDLDNWSRVIPLPQGSVTDSQFFLQLENAIKNDVKIQALEQQSVAAREASNFSESLNPSDFLSLTTVNKAIALNDKNLSSMDAHATALYALSTRMSGQVQEEYNIIQDALNSSDVEFNSYYPNELRDSYLYGIMQYQQKVLAISSKCFKQKKCTIKVLDSISLKISDKLIQKEFDVIKAEHLRVYGAEYEKQKSKGLPPVGSKPANT